MGNNNKTQKDLLRKEKEKEIKKMKKNKGSASSTATNGEEEEEGGGGGGGDIWAFEAAPAQTKKKNKPAHAADGVVLGLDGGTTSTVCVCIPAKIPSSSSSSFKAAKVPILSRSVAGCSNHNSVGEAEARDTLEKVMAQVLSKAGYTRSVVKAVCLSLSGVNHPSDQDRVLGWLRDIFPSHVMLYVDNDAVAALASGTTGKLHGCVLIVGTGSIAYGFTEDGREARAAGAGPVLGDWGSGYGIAAQALTAVIKAYDGRGPETILTNNILKELGLPSPDELIGWTYADPSWARIAALVPVVVSSAEVGDEVANRILHRSVQELADGVKAVVQRLELCGKDGRDHFPLVLVGGVLNAKKSWDIGKEVISRISNVYPGVQAIRPEVEPAVGAAMVAWTRYVRESVKKQPQKVTQSTS